MAVKIRWRIIMGECSWAVIIKVRTIDDLVVMVNGATIFSTVDFIKAFDLMMQSEESRDFTTITKYFVYDRFKNT